MKRKIIIGSRGSDLALWQANFLRRKLASIGISSRIQIIKTKGDIIQNISLTKVEGKGFFTKELEDALLNKEIDVAVHSYKDLPTAPTPGLIIAANSKREDASELLIINKEATDNACGFSLKKNAIVGTSSPRRKSQLLSFRPDLKLADLRGNVPTRIRKLQEKNYDAILIANAGVSRLKIDLKGFYCEKISPQQIIPAPAQGVLAYQIREKDFFLKKEFRKLHDEAAEKELNVERKILELFQGGCQIPVGVFCKKEKGFYNAWIAKAKDWNYIPLRFFYRSKSHRGLAENIFKKIKSVRPSKIFITSEIEEESYLKRMLTANNFEVKGNSLIDFAPVAFDGKIPRADWIFFTSKNSVKYFFSQKPVLYRRVRFAVMGEGTKKTLHQHGFISDEMGYKNLSGVVLFPRAENSLRTVQQAVSRKAKIIDLVVYQNQPKNNFKIPPSDILIFTSPMNVTAFFQKNRIKKENKIIAIGNTTAEKLKSFGVKNIFVPDTPDEVSLVDMVMSC